MRARSFRHFVVVTAALLSACRVAGGGGGGVGDSRPTEAKETVIALSSYRRTLTADAITDFLGYDLSVINSAISVAGYVAEDGTSLEKMASPTAGCSLLSAKETTLKISRALDLGDALISIGSEKLAIKKADDFSIFEFAYLNEGTFSLKNTDFPTAMTLDHKLEVLEPSDSITVSSGANLDQKIAITGSVTSGDPSWTTHISKSAGATIRVQAPAGTSYVSVLLHDGQYKKNADTGAISMNAATAIQCFAAPGADITIPASLMDAFKVPSDPSTSLANLTVDLVAVERKTHQGKITDALLESRTRQIQGGAILIFQDGSDANKLKQAASPFSSVVIEP